MEKLMKAVVFKGNGVWKIEDRPVPQIKNSDDVLLRVEAASICGTDVHILETPPGHPANPDTILCHEYTGEVIEVGSGVTTLKPGDRVVVDPNITCGKCVYCKNDMPNMCINMTTLGIFIDGGFAKYNVAPERALHRIPPSLEPEIAVFAEPLSCVVNALGKVNLFPGESVVVLGAGPIGLYFTSILKKSGCGNLIVSEPNPYRASFAYKAGADRVVNPKEENLYEIVMETTGIGADVVIDAVGTLFGEALKVVRRDGRIVLFGMNENVKPEISQYEITRKEIAIYGTYISKYSFPQTIKILSSGILPLRTFITHTLPLENFGEGLEAMREGKAIKVIIKP